MYKIVKFPGFKVILTNQKIPDPWQHVSEQSIFHFSDKTKGQFKCKSTTKNIDTIMNITKIIHILES